jgi:hypothetical protein
MAVGQSEADAVRGVLDHHHVPDVPRNVTEGTDFQLPLLVGRDAFEMTVELMQLPSAKDRAQRRALRPLVPLPPGGPGGRTHER